MPNDKQGKLTAEFSEIKLNEAKARVILNHEKARFYAALRLHLTPIYILLLFILVFPVFDKLGQ